MYLKKFLRFMRPADADGGAGGGTIDRGDDFVPTDDDAVADEATKKAADDAAAAIIADQAAKDAKKSALKTDAVDDATLTDEEKAAAAEKAAKGKDTRIPAARHKEILDKERERRTALETELAQYKQGGKIADVNAEITEAESKLVGLEKAYAKQLTDGETDKAAATMTDIRRLERSINNKSAELRETAAVARAVETARYDTTVERLEAQFPALNVDHEDFDKAKTGEVLELKEAYQLKGYTPSAALQKAVRLIMPPETKKQEAALDTEARVDPKKVEAERKAAAVAKTADAIDKTPANAGSVGKAHDELGGGAVTAKDIMKMPYKDFIKLDEDMLARARGDVL